MDSKRLSWTLPREKYFLFFLLFFSVLMFTMEHINGRFWLNDFKVMYSAANAYQQGDQVYNVAFGLGSGFYKYSPVTLLFFIPYTWLSYDWAANIHFFLIAFVLLLLTRALYKLLAPQIEEKRQLLFYAVLFTTIVVHLTRELHLGNVNLILIYLVIQMLLFWKNNRMIPGATLLALVIFTKPYLVLLLIPFVLRFQWKAILSTMVVMTLLTLAASALIGFSKMALLSHQWIQAIMDHSAEAKSDQTIFTIIHKLTGAHFSSAATYGSLIVVGLLITFLLQRGKSIPQQESYTRWALLPAFIILSLVPNFLITDTEHFLFSLPLIYWIYSNFSTFSKTEIVLYAMGLSLFAFHPGLSFGTLGIGNLVVVFTTVFSAYRNREIKPKSNTKN